MTGFCKSASLEEIERNGFSLTPGRYVGASAGEIDLEPFPEKLNRLAQSLEKLGDESKTLDKKITVILGSFSS